VTQDSDLDLFEKMSALEFGFELLVANELAHVPKEPRAPTSPKKRNRANTLPSGANSAPRKKPKRKGLSPATTGG
jgi:hypothetical protein